MINFEGKFLRVFDPQIKLQLSEKKVFATVTSSRKDARTEPATYIRSKWFDVAFVGDAFEPAKAFRGGELIDVTKGCITHEKRDGKYYLNLTVFEFVLSEVNTDDDNDAPEEE